MRIAEFGVDEPATEQETFGYFGVEIRVADDFGEAAFIDWMEQWGTVDENDPKAITAGKALMREAIHVDDFAEFWSLVRKHRQSTIQLLEVVNKLIEATTGRPTGLPSDSSAGQSITQVKSVDDYSSQAIHSLLDREAPRADLALVVAQAQEYQMASA